MTPVTPFERELKARVNARLRKLFGGVDRDPTEEEVQVVLQQVADELHAERAMLRQAWVELVERGRVLPS